MGTAALDATSDLRRPYLCALRDVHIRVSPNSLPLYGARAALTTLRSSRPAEPGGLDPEGRHEHRLLRQVLQRPHDRRVRPPDLGRRAQLGEAAGAARAARPVDLW